MNLTFPQLLAGCVGALLLYSAVVNKTPGAVLKEALSGTAKAPHPVATAYTGQQWGPYNPTGTGLQPGTGTQSRGGGQQ